MESDLAKDLESPSGKKRYIMVFVNSGASVSSGQASYPERPEYVGDVMSHNMFGFPRSDVSLTCHLLNQFFAHLQGR